jgi:O-antigen/teichoic acid export membrane protein
VAVSFPALIRLYEAGQEEQYFAEFRRLATLAGVLSGVILLGLGAAMPVLGMLVHKPALLANGLDLRLLLVATWIRTDAETAYYLLFIERKLKAVWAGNIMFLIASSTFNILLIPRYGIAGLGGAALISATALFAWRMWFGRPGSGRSPQGAQAPAVSPL